MIFRQITRCFFVLSCLAVLLFQLSAEEYGPTAYVDTDSNQISAQSYYGTKKPIEQEIFTIATQDLADEGYTVNLEDIPVLQLIRFISQITGTNFVFDSAELQFNISFVSEDPTSAEDLMASLLQILKMHGLSALEQGNNVVIYPQSTLSKVSTIISDKNVEEMSEYAVVTRVFRLYNLSPAKVRDIIKPLLSNDAIVEVVEETRQLIVSDISANVEKIAELLVVLDQPNAALDIAEYHAKSSYPSALVAYAKEILQPMLVDNPLQLIPQPSSKKIFIVSTPYLIQKALQVLESLDAADIIDTSDLPSSNIANNQFFVYRLQYHQGRDIVDGLRSIGSNLQQLNLANMDLVSSIQSIVWIETNNSLVITGTESVVDKIKVLIKDLDTPLKQVYIEVLIIDTTIRNSLDFGVEWVALGNQQNQLAYASGFLDSAPSSAPTQTLTGTPQNPLVGGARSAGSSPPPTSTRGGAAGTGGDIPLTSGFGLGIIGNIIRHKGQTFLTLGALVSALETEGDTVLVLNPRIMTEESQEANVFVGQNIPYQTTSSVVRDTGSVTQNIQYEDIGVQLRVTPMISPGNMVTLVIDQSISDVTSSTATVNTVGGATTLLLAPTTNKTVASTRVHVPDGSFLVMSGHIRDVQSDTRSGIPCLGSLPLIGPVFSNTQQSREKRNLIMFIRPKVITNSDQAMTVTNQEGYDYNWESHPQSLLNCGPQQAPECETN